MFFRLIEVSTKKRTKKFCNNGLFWFISQSTEKILDSFLKYLCEVIFHLSYIDTKLILTCCVFQYLKSKISTQALLKDSSSESSSSSDEDEEDDEQERQSKVKLKDKKNEVSGVTICEPGESEK